ncbi:MAG TPA: hypothetical protein VI583_13735 [Cyclobacteriaceae bacterium]|nr:hypothetical protein [Cyclobacteriaceae bacterium]
MKTKSVIVFALSLTALISSCTVFSVHPLYTDSNVVREDKLIGLWREFDEGDAYVEINPLHPPAYSLTYWEDEDTLRFDIHYLKVGNYYFIDLYPDADFITEMLMDNYFPVHSFLKIELSDKGMYVYMFNGEKMIQLFKQNRIRLKHELINLSGKEYNIGEIRGLKDNRNCVLITAETEDLQKFILKYSSDKESFEDPMIFEKVN